VCTSLHAPIKTPVALVSAPGRLNIGVYAVQPGDKDWIVNLLSVS